ncbi:uncharacterized protein PGTG_09043 [Puccinia graminis f. sp. tritici CRL 75-36-700-3]|uniref:RNA polymerase II assembly factor Rtp1 C-terminal domain-containing protein n=1 Tax=Puccinia graminis f. sp. tritici (strain CRL 75-36-700-3 / race SCCL) TaxID=418459 RepID=E3KFM6_PUCGT|nr:uncharacterized protein PGTG_09043 [Puccinia graminis f. sp. tritici CRL 75-36-700-3]EFP83090.1 hypothetical protein PGTG_09043 [Puccinia graminis f. sp. tritici CRL 75-36-700-3]
MTIEELKELINKNYNNNNNKNKNKKLSQATNNKQTEQEELIRRTNELIESTINTIKPPTKTIINQTISEEFIISKNQKQLKSTIKSIQSTISLEILISLNNQIREKYQLEQQQQQQHQPILGSNDLRAIQHLAQTISNYSIYTQPSPIEAGFPSFTFEEIIQSLTQIILPSDLIQLINDKKENGKQTQALISLHPRFALHQALFSSLLTPLTAGLIKLRSNTEHSQWADHHLHQLLDLASPKLVFASLLSLATTVSALQKKGTTDGPRKSQNKLDAQSEISQVLSLRLLRPSGLRGLLQSVITEDYNEDDEEIEEVETGKATKSPVTSATLKRFESLYHIISHPPSSVSPTLYWDTILKNLIKLVTPQFFDQQPATGGVKAPDSIRRAACYIISQITSREATVFKAHLSPLLHSAFRPSQPTSYQSSSEEEDEDQIVVSSPQIDHTLQLLNQLVLNSEPSPIFVDRLVVPILPQLLSLILFLLRTRAEPTVRRAAEELVQLWMRLHPAQTVAGWLGRAIRELEAGRELSPRSAAQPLPASSRANQWARDPTGMPCIKTRPASQPDTLDFPIEPETLIVWFQSLKTHQFLGHILTAWLDEVVLLRGRAGFVEAKMTLFRIQSSLKILDAFEIPQIVAEPRHFFPFILHALRLHPSSNTPFPSKPPKQKKKKKKDQQAAQDGPLTLDSLKFLNLDRSPVANQGLHQDVSEEESEADEEDDVDLDHGIMVAGLSLLLALLEGHPDMEEENTPGLREISGLLDGLLLNQAVSSEVYDLGIKSRLLLSVRKAISEVDRGQQQEEGRVKSSEDRAFMEEKAGLEGQYREGLGLLNDECLPLRSQGIVQLKTVLLTPTSDRRIRAMVEGWAPGVIELLLRAVEDADSFVYLSAINALSALAHRFHALVGPALAEAFARPILHPSQESSQTTALRDFDRSVRVAEAMVQVIQRAGTALPLYIDKLLPSLLLVLNHTHSIADPLKPSALATLALCVEHAPAALAPSLSGLVQACVGILSSAGMARKPDEGSGQSSDGETFSDDESGEELGEEESVNHSSSTPNHPESSPITSPIHAAHHRASLHRAALLFVQSLLSHTLSLCRSVSSSSSSGATVDRTVVRTVRSAIGDHFDDLERVLKYILLARNHHRPARLPKSGNYLPPNQPSADKGLVAASLIQNTLDSLAVLRAVLTYY